MLRDIQDQLKLLWTGERYSREFLESAVVHKDFNHALLHVAKATGKLAAITEELDHDPQFASRFSRRDGRKFVADLIICAVRMANTMPGGEIDVTEAVIERIKEKM